MTSSQKDMAELLRTRYGDRPDIPLGVDTTAAAGAEGTLKTLISHRSIRRFAQTNVPPGALELMIAAAQSASTSSNLQCWTAITIDDPERRRALAQVAGDQKYVEACPLFIAWVVDLARLERIGQLVGSPTAGLEYLESFVIGVVDTALAAQNAAIAAESMGLGITYIGGLRNDPLRVALELALPARSFVLFGMCVGYPRSDATTAIKPRLPLASVLHRERYDQSSLREQVGAYDEIMADFYRTNAMPARGQWSSHSMNRIRDASALKGRDQLAQVLMNMGFDLQ